MAERAGDDGTCSALFHHTTAGGYCSRCGQSWKHRRRRAAATDNDLSATAASDQSSTNGPETC